MDFNHNLKRSIKSQDRFLSKTVMTLQSVHFLWLWCTYFFSGCLLGSLDIEEELLIRATGNLKSSSFFYCPPSGMVVSNIRKCPSSVQCSQLCMRRRISNGVQTGPRTRLTLCTSTLKMDTDKYQNMLHVKATETPDSATLALGDVTIGHSCCSGIDLLAREEGFRPYLFHFRRNYSHKMHLEKRTSPFWASVSASVNWGWYWPGRVAEKVKLLIVLFKPLDKINTK